MPQPRSPPMRSRVRQNAGRRYPAFRQTRPPIPHAPRVRTSLPRVGIRPRAGKTEVEGLYRGDIIGRPARIGSQEHRLHRLDMAVEERHVRHVPVSKLGERLVHSPGLRRGKRDGRHDRVAFLNVGRRPAVQQGGIAEQVRLARRVILHPLHAHGLFVAVSARERQTARRRGGILHVPRRLPE
jgi:hypothetical protein